MESFRILFSSAFNNRRLEMNVRNVLEQLRTSPDREQQFLNRLGRLTTPVLFLPRAGLQVQEANAEGKIAEYKSFDGSLIARAVSYTCNARAINNLTVDGNPLTAKRFSYSVGPISWAAGEGWPIYTSYCPVDAYGANMYYREAKSHQNVPSIKGQNYFIGCSSSGVCESAGVGQVAFAVNDDGYVDNRGYFEVVIYSWS